MNAKNKNDTVTENDGICADHVPLRTGHVVYGTDPVFQVGIVEFSVEYFLFIPLTLAMLFDPLSAALGAATGELVFSEIMLGQLAALESWKSF